MNYPVQAVIAANRFGLGARPGDLTAISADPRGWLKSQLTGERLAPSVITELAASDEIYRAQVAALRARQEMQRNASESENQTATGGVVSNPILNNYQSQVVARYQVAIRSEESFRERLIHFWTNHFAVSMDKNIVSAMAGTLENEAIRPNIHRSFYDLLLAAEMHPSMILYLDNQLSVGPNSGVAKIASQRTNLQRLRKFDINENLGREILELHTLGVSGGYTQDDVTRFATVLTGWSISDSQGPLALPVSVTGERERIPDGRFIFKSALHEPDTQTVMGKRYSEQGIKQGQSVLRDLAMHPSTANFIATKLARHFIADQPPTVAIDRIAKAFLRSEGDLPTVHAAIVDSSEAWVSSVSKFKTPHELVISTFRATNTIPDRSLLVLQPLQALGQSPYSPGSPAGWDDTAGRWDGSDALMKRIEWLTQFAQRINRNQSPLYLAEQSLGEAIGEHTRMAVTNAADRAQGTVLWLVSPEFQRR